MSDQKHTPELKPCPFCGRHDLVILEMKNDDTDIYAYSVHCRVCMTIGPHEGGIGWAEPPKEASEAWNTRPESAGIATPKAQRNELKKYIVDELCDYVQEVMDDHIQKFGMNYKPYSLKYYESELAKIDRIKAGQS